YELRPGDLVMTRKGTIGNCAVYPAAFPVGVMHSDLLRIRLNTKVCDPIFMTYQLHLNRSVEHQISLISGGAIMAGINVGKLKRLEVLVPDIDRQMNFAKQISSTESIRETMMNGIFELDQIFS